MKKILINPLNVVSAATLILEMDNNAICDIYRLDAGYWITNLKEALEQFTNSKSLPHSKSALKTIDGLEHSLEYLLKCTDAIIPLLTKEASQSLGDSLELRESARNY